MAGSLKTMKRHSYALNAILLVISMIYGKFNFNIVMYDYFVL